MCDILFRRFIESGCYNGFVKKVVRPKIALLLDSPEEDILLYRVYTQADFVLWNKQKDMVHDAKLQKGSSMYTILCVSVTLSYRHIRFQYVSYDTDNFIYCSFTLQRRSTNTIAC